MIVSDSSVDKQPSDTWKRMINVVSASVNKDDVFTRPLTGMEIEKC